MTLRSLKTISGFAVAAATTLLLIGCRGAAGQDGQPGQSGNVINVTSLTSAQWAKLRLKGEVTGVTNVGTRPVVSFKLTDANGTPVSGMSWTSKSASAAFATYPNLFFGIAKLMPEKISNGVMVAPSRWVNYIVTSPAGTDPDQVTWTPTRPTTDNNGELVDNGDGTYKYTFRRDISQVKTQLDTYTYSGNNKKEDLDDVTYEPTMTHRVTIQVSGAYRGTGTNTENAANSGYTSVGLLQPANIIYDFIPSSNRPVNDSDAQRELVSTAACNECHGVLGRSFHGGSRTDARYCAICHTDQRKYGYADNTDRKQKNHAVGDFIMLGHTLHIGNRGFNKAGLSPRNTVNYNYAGVEYKKIGYPMDIRNCVQCHKGDQAAQSDNWKKKPSRLACGACHDGIDWTQSHHGAVRADDSTCGTCHSETGDYSPFKSHRPADITKQNSTTRYSNFTYDLRQVTLTSDRRPIIEFRIKLNGETMSTRASLSPTGFSGGPGFYIVYALPQDGIDRPADFNVYTNVQLANIISGTSGTLSTSPDNDGYWTATLSGNAIPANASMVTVYMARAWTQSDIVVAQDPNYDRYRVTPSKKVLVSGITNNVARREVVSAAKCNDCHEMLGTSYITRYYGAHGGGMANDPSLCGACHYVNRSGNGWSGNIQYITHAVHGIGKRTVQYARYRDNKATPYSLNGIGESGYPGVTNNCEQCHLPGTYDFRTTASHYDNLLWSTVAAGNITVGDNTAPYLSAGNYGSAWSSTAQATTATLVNSPITHACFGCHDSTQAINHMKHNGGSFFVSRGSVNGNVQGAKLTNNETCLLCHGSGRSADIKSVHAKF